MLGEQNELTQELASQGMSIVYELGDAAMKKTLVDALVTTLTGSGKRKRAIKVKACLFSFGGKTCYLLSSPLMLFIFLCRVEDDVWSFLIYSWKKTLKFSKRGLLVKV